MSKRKSVAVVQAGKAKVPAKPPPVNSVTDEIRVLDWDKCFTCLIDLSEKLQSSLSATSVNLQLVYQNWTERT